MIKPITNAGFGEDIFARYENPMSPLLPADMTFLQTEKEEEEETPNVRYETYLNNINEINNSTEENIILNLKVDFHFLNKMLSRSLPSAKLSTRVRENFLENLSTPKGREDMAKEILSQVEPIINKEMPPIVLKEEAKEEQAEDAETVLLTKKVKELRESVFKEEKLIHQKERLFEETEKTEEREALKKEIEESKVILTEKQLLYKEALKEKNAKKKEASKASKKAVKKPLEDKKEEISRVNAETVKENTSSDLTRTYIDVYEDAPDVKIKKESINRQVFEKMPREAYIPEAKVIYKEETVAPTEEEQENAIRRKMENASYRLKENAFLSAESIIYKKAHPEIKKEEPPKKAPAPERGPAKDAFVAKKEDRISIPEGSLVLSPDIFLKGIGKAEIKMPKWNTTIKNVRAEVPERVREILKKGTFISQKFTREEMLKSIFADKIIYREIEPENTEKEAPQEESWTPEQKLKMSVIHRLYKENKLSLFMKPPMEFLKNENENTEREDALRSDKVYIENIKRGETAYEEILTEKVKEKVLRQKEEIPAEIKKVYLQKENVISEKIVEKLAEAEEKVLFKNVLSSREAQKVKFLHDVKTSPKLIYKKAEEEEIDTLKEAAKAVLSEAEAPRTIKKVSADRRIVPLNFRYSKPPMPLDSVISTPDGDITLSEVFNFIRTERSPEASPNFDARVREKLKIINKTQKVPAKYAPIDLEKLTPMVREEILEGNIDHKMRLNSQIVDVPFKNVPIINKEEPEEEPRVVYKTLRAGSFTEHKDTVTSENRKLAKREVPAESSVIYKKSEEAFRENAPEGSRIRYNTIENNTYLPQKNTVKEIERVSYKEVKVPELSMIYKRTEEKAKEEEEKKEEVYDDIVTIKNVINKPEEKTIERNVAVNAPAPLMSSVPVQNQKNMMPEINKIADKVYKILEKRLRFESMRRGGF